MITGLLILWLGAELLGSAIPKSGDLREPLGAILGSGGFLVFLVPGIALIGLIGSARAKTAIVRRIFHVLWILMLLVALRVGYKAWEMYSGYSYYQEIGQTENDALYQRALDGHPMAQVRWGDKRYKIWQYGAQGAHDEACFDALHWYLQAAYQGSADGQESVGSAYLSCVPALPKNKTRLIYLWYRIADENPVADPNTQVRIDRFFDRYVGNRLEIDDAAIENTLQPWVTELESLYRVYDE